MGDYTPVQPTGAIVTFTASADVTGGQLVEVTGDMEVGPAGAGSIKVAGVASCDCPAGSELAVFTPAANVEEVEVAASVEAGDHLKAAAAGTVTEFTVGTDSEPARLGLCIQGQSTVGSLCRYLTV